MIKSKIVQTIKVKIPTIIMAILVSVIFIYYTSYGNANLDNTPNWVKDGSLIAHALGGIDGSSYTNSLEAFISNYKKGFRAFEVDLIFSSDGFLIAKHDWITETIPPLSLKEFKNRKVYNKYTSLSFEDIARLMKQYPDMYIITDAKETKKEDVLRAFKSIYDTSLKVDKSILDRIIPQIFYPDMLTIINSVYKFKNIIYTLYLSHASDNEVIKSVIMNNIKIVTMPKKRCDKAFIERLRKNGIYVYVHTVDTIKDMQLFRQMGANGFYTNFLSP
jgi:glycerophosphoryl diester phosphodiesterase